MPNGTDKNWIRCCAAIDGFRSLYGRWPARVRLFPVALEEIRDHILTPDGFARVSSLIELVPDDEAPMIAEDETGSQYNYGQQGFPGKQPDVSAVEWFGHPELRRDVEGLQEGSGLEAALELAMRRLGRDTAGRGSPVKI